MSLQAGDTFGRKVSRPDAELVAAFAGEPQACLKHTFAAIIAKQARYEQLATDFPETTESGSSRQQAGCPGRPWTSNWRRHAERTTSGPERTIV